MATPRTNSGADNSFNGLTIQEFRDKHGLVSMNQNLGFSKHDVPFITMIDGDNKAKNAFFSSKLLEDYPRYEELVDEETGEIKEVEIVYPIDPKEFFVDKRIYEYLDEKGVKRIKIGKAGGNSKRVSLLDI